MVALRERKKSLGLVAPLAPMSYVASVNRRFDVIVPVTVTVSPTALPSVTLPVNDVFPEKVHAPLMVWSFSQTAMVLPES